jgi:dolichol kinase
MQRYWLSLVLLIGVWAGFYNTDLRWMQYPMTLVMGIALVLTLLAWTVVKAKPDEFAKQYEKIYKNSPAPSPTGRFWHFLLILASLLFCQMYITAAMSILVRVIGDDVAARRKKAVESNAPHV